MFVTLPSTDCLSLGGGKHRVLGQSCTESRGVVSVIKVRSGRHSLETYCVDRQGGPTDVEDTARVAVPSRIKRFWVPFPSLAHNLNLHLPVGVFDTQSLSQRASLRVGHL
jgi:hypothetical protein